MMTVKWEYISGLSDEDIDRWHNTAPRDRISAVERKRNEADRLRSILGDVLAVRTINDITCRTDIVLKRDASGRPYVDSLPLFISVSHSGSIAVCAVSDRPVGIDVEQIKKRSFKLTDRIFSKDEIAYISGSAKRFFEVWTAKEAYAKMTGEGIRAVLRGIYTDIKSGNVMGEALSITEYNGYICSVVTKKDQDMGVIF